MIETIRLAYDTEVIKTTKPIINIINLSSYPNHALKVRLNYLIEQRSKNINILPIIPPMSHYCQSSRLIRIKKTKAIWTIVDEDDDYHNIKIRSLNKVMNYLTIGKIIVCASQIPKMNPKLLGTSVTLMNHHHLKEELAIHGARTNISTATEKISNVVIRQTNSKTSGSVSGLKLYCYHLELSYTVFEHDLKNEKTWLLLPKELIQDLHTNNNNIVIDIIPDGDKSWSFKQNYTNLIYTTTGPKEFIIKNKKHNEKGNSIIMKIIRWFKKLKEKIFEKLWLFFTRNNRRKTGLGWSSITTVSYISTLFSYIRIKLLPVNASHEIDRANKLLSGWYMIRAAQKDPVISNKTELIKKITKPLASYIVGTQSYTTQEAAITADIKAVKERRKQCIRMLIINMLVLIITNAIKGRVIITVILGIINIISITTMEYELGVLLSGIISPTHLLSKIYLLTLLASEGIINLRHTFKKQVFIATSVVMLITQTITKLI